MKKLALLLFCAGLAPALLLAQGTAPSSSAAPAAGGLRYTIAVTKFENHAKYGGAFGLADCWGAVLTDSLQKSGHFIVIAESDMRSAAMGEQDFARSGRAATGDKAPVTGVMTPAQLLVKGEITHFQDGTESTGGNVGIAGISLGLAGSTAEVNAVIYIVDSSTGQVVASKQVVGTCKSSGVKVGFANSKWSGDVNQVKNTNAGKAIAAAIDQAVAFCTAQLPSLHWSGEVILVKGPQVYINRGEREGVAVGEQFKVGMSEIVRDPGTGEVLDVNFTQVAQIKVDAVKEKVAICSVISGSNVDKGMSVAPL